MKKLILILLFAISLVSCESKKRDIDAELKETLADTISSNYEMTEQQNYLDQHDFKTDAEFTDSQFQEFKNLMDSGLFEEVSFCEVYQTALNLQDKELKRYLKPFNKIEYFETMLFSYGSKVCTINKINNLNSNESTGLYQILDSDSDACVIAKDFIKSDLKYPNTADFDTFDCTSERNSDNSYTVLRKVSAKNAFGVESSFVYKLKIGLKSGHWLETNNWKLLSIRSEEYK